MSFAKPAPPVRHEFVLFLDFDGVLHPRTSGTGRHIPALEALLRRHPQVELVVSSTWKHQYSVEDLKGWFSSDIQERVIGVTPDLPNLPGARQLEIEAWLRMRSSRRWLALDDEPALFSPGCPWLYLTETATGLTSADLVVLDSIFQGS